MNNKFFLYARKSTDDLSRQIRSIDDQIAELRELAKRESLDIVETLIEKQTAKAPGRPVFNAMLERIEKGEANGILAWHPDRLARNPLDGGRIIHFVDIGKITDLRFPTCPFDPTPSGKFMLAIMFGQSKYYVDSLGENIKRGQRRKLADGIWPMFTPIGYLNDRTKKSIYPDPERSPLIREIFTLYATGLYTLDQIKETADALGLTNREGQPLSRSQIHRMLSNPLYCGIIEWKGETHEGRHEPLVTKELFDQVQSVINRKSKPRAPRLKPYLYRGFLRCGECGAFITTETQKGHNYLRCTKRVKKDCSQPYVREEEVTHQITDAVASFALPTDTADWLLAELQDLESDGLKETASATNAAQATCRDIDQKITLLTDAYLAQVLSLPEYRETRAKLIAEKQVLKDRLTAIESNRGNWFEPATRFVSAARHAGFLAENGSDTEKRDFLRETGSNLRVLNRELRFEPRGAWKLVANQGVLAHNENTAPQSGAVFSHGESHHDLKRREIPDSSSGLSEGFGRAFGGPRWR